MTDTKITLRKVSDGYDKEVAVLVDGVRVGRVHEYNRNEWSWDLDDAWVGDRGVYAWLRRDAVREVVKAHAGFVARRKLKS